MGSTTPSLPRRTSRKPIFIGIIYETTLQGICCALTASRVAASVAQCPIHAGFDAQVFGDAFGNQAENARGGIAPAGEHPVQRLFPQAGLAREFLERDNLGSVLLRPLKNNCSGTL